MRSAAICGGLVLMLAACAADAGPDGPPHDRGRRDGGDVPPRRRVMLFVSPMGQPFRAAPGAPYPVSKWFDAADANHDGRLSRAEFRADAEAFFHVLDSNHDGVIDSFENDAYERSIPEMSGGLQDDPQGDDDERDGSAHRRRGDGMVGGGFGDGPLQARDGRGGFGGRGGPMGGGNGGNDLRADLYGVAPYGLLGDPQPVRSADADQSQSVFLTEFMEAADRRFDRLDTNGDGFIDRGELPPTPVQGAGRKRRPK